MNTIRERWPRLRERLRSFVYMDNQEEKKVNVQNEAPVTERPAPLVADACPECNGEGLLGDPAGQNSVCPKCGGTGKTSHNQATGDNYPEGTTLVRQDGTFRVVNGELVKVE